VGGGGGWWVVVVVVVVVVLLLRKSSFFPLATIFTATTVDELQGPSRFTKKVARPGQ
jgi:hypothetical protein